MQSIKSEQDEIQFQFRKQYFQIQQEHKFNLCDNPVKKINFNKKAEEYSPAFFCFHTII